MHLSRNAVRLGVKTRNVFCYTLSTPPRQLTNLSRSHVLLQYYKYYRNAFFVTKTNNKIKHITVKLFKNTKYIFETITRKKKTMKIQLPITQLLCHFQKSIHTFTEIVHHQKDDDIIDAEGQQESPGCNHNWSLYFGLKSRQNDSNFATRLPQSFISVPARGKATNIDQLVIWNSPDSLNLDQFHWF